MNYSVSLDAGPVPGVIEKGDRPEPVSSRGEEPESRGAEERSVGSDLHSSGLLLSLICFTITLIGY